ncbi:formate dehydrogenase subunit alpha [Roseateles toxinivorans]|uniref:nitrate reductase (cytochrome) n=1 Tax=Roseateles toxinivorans TaxID=270368 RepID=A0A4R6QQE9_9BURK|nr:formate dehydrogenase subunit alpha [Roseateles toxinivorans]TDP72699.1 NAD-dependent formate dehydrogenase catalytic subunit /NAD-dependent formate dehydrogenase iron-sulfur protein [Roseateles toxinivorans]
MSGIAIEIDGLQVEAEQGETLLSVAQRHGHAIPHLCHMDGLTPAGNCRACVVEIEGERALAASCCRTVKAGQKIHLQTARVQRSQKMVLELLMANQPRTPHRRASELTQWCESLGVTGSRFAARPQPAPDRSHPAISVQLDACIQCMRCVRACRDEQVNDVLGIAGWGADTRISFDADDALGASSCVACGECVQACPTGALTPANGAALQQADAVVASVCAFCGVGCQLDYRVKDNKILEAVGRDGPANHGRLCVKGRYGYDYVQSAERLTVPLMRREGVAKDPADIALVRQGLKPLSDLFREASWDEALDFAATGLRQLRDSHALGADSPLAGFGSAKGSNEEAYLFQKLVRQGFGTNNVDHCTRLCHASSVAALLEGIGSGSVSNPVADVAQAEVILLIGANPSSNHPVAASFIKNAVKAGSTLIVADPRRAPMARFARWHLAFRPDSDVALLNGMLHTIIDEGLTDPAFIAARVNGFEALKAAVAECTPERMSEICGIAPELIREVARCYATAKSAMILWGMGISQHVHGTDNARCLIALAMITGQIGRPGTGLHPLRGQNNVQGASDAGLIPMMLPNYQRVARAEVREQFEALWAVPLSSTPGLTVVEIMHAASEGRIKGMFVEGENPAMSDPDLDHARRALAGLQHLVVQDIFATETALLADVILPASAHAEKWGSYTNTDRLIQLGRPAITPPGDARQDLWIIEQLGRRLGLPWAYWTEADGQGHAAAEAPTARVYEEMRQVMAPLAGVPWSRLQRENAVTTPAAREDEPGERVVFHDHFPLADGRSQLVPATFTPGPEQPDAQYPLVLTTGRVLEHWHTGAMTRRATALEALAPAPQINIHPEDAAGLHLHDGQTVDLRSRHGQVQAQVQLSREVQPGQVFLPFCYWEAAANLLTGDALDAVGKIPGFKVTAVRVEALLISA